MHGVTLQIFADCDELATLSYKKNWPGATCGPKGLHLAIHN